MYRGANVAHVLLTFLILAFVAGRASPVAAANVAVIMSADVAAYQEALRGFQGSVRERIVTKYDMEGDFDRGQKIVAEIRSKVKPDLIFAVGIWALQVLTRHPTEIPVVYAMVLNPPAVVGRAKNITGASMNVPVEEAIRLFQQLGPRVRRVGVIFNRAKTGYLVRQAEMIAQKEGLQLVAKEIRSPGEAISALDALQEEGIDAFWILPDETILVRAVLKHMLLVSYRTKLPLLGLSERQARMGALLSLSFASSEDIGRQAGELANGILGGRAPGEIPYTTARQVNLTVNLKAARKLGMEIPQTILGRANTVIR